MSDFPRLRSQSMDDIVGWIEEVTRLRFGDVADKDNLPEEYVQGRKSPRIPSSADDVTDFDRVGDINYDGKYLYILVLNENDELKWLRIEGGTTTPWPEPPEPIPFSTQSQATTGTNNNTIMTPLRVAQSVDHRRRIVWDTGFITIAAQHSQTYTNGLPAGVTPRHIYMQVRLTSAVGGYPIGTIFQSECNFSATGTNQVPYWPIVSYNGRNVYVRHGNGTNLIYVNSFQSTGNLVGVPYTSATIRFFATL